MRRYVVVVFSDSDDICQRALLMMVLPTLANKNNLILTDARESKTFYWGRIKKTFESYRATRSAIAQRLHSETTVKTNTKIPCWRMARTYSKRPNTGRQGEQPKKTIVRAKAFSRNNFAFRGSRMEPQKDPPRKGWNPPKQPSP